MVSGVKRISLSCAVVGLLLGGTGHAAVQTKTISGNMIGPLTLSLFNPTLGTLLSVNAEATYTAWLPYLYYGTPVGYDQAVSGTAMLGGFSFALSGSSIATQSSFDSGVFTVSASGTATWTNPADMTLFTGTSGSLTGYVANINTPTAPGTLRFGNYQPAVNYKLTYTYDNSPAVPEPATWAMMVGGFGLLGATLRAARRMRPASAPAADG